jgi:hypothetical protein
MQVKHSDLGILAECQLTAADALANGYDLQTVRNRLGVISITTAVLAYFAVATVAALASLITEVGSVIGPSEREIVIGGLNAGKDGLSKWWLGLVKRTIKGYGEDEQAILSIQKSIDFLRSSINKFV